MCFYDHRAPHVTYLNFPSSNHIAIFDFHHCVFLHKISKILCLPRKLIIHYLKAINYPLSQANYREEQLKSLHSLL